MIHKSLCQIATIRNSWMTGVCETNGISIHYRRTGKADVLAQARARHPHRGAEFIELVTEARLQTRIDVFEVLTPPNPGYQQLVSAIRVPILLVTADGGVVSAATARALQNLNPRLQIQQIEDAGHGIPYDQPEHFASVVGSWLRSVFS